MTHGYGSFSSLRAYCSARYRPTARINHNANRGTFKVKTSRQFPLVRFAREERKIFDNIFVRGGPGEATFSCSGSLVYKIACGGLAHMPMVTSGLSWWSLWLITSLLPMGCSIRAPNRSRSRKIGGKERDRKGTRSPDTNRRRAFGDPSLA